MEYIYFLFLFGPGLALAFYFINYDGVSVFDRILLGMGISVAFYPVLFLLTYLLGLPVNRVVIYLCLSLGLLALAWRFYQYRPSFSFSFLKEIPLNTWLAWLFLVIVLVLSLYVRVAIVKDLEVPMWSDSYHHTMISQLFIDNQGIFRSWDPYVPLETFTYHFGFHSLAASYHWLTGIDVPRSVIVTGQMLNFLMVLGCYLLATQLARNPWAGNFAAIFVGLIFTMPAYYVNWGRYSQLTGLALLPAAMLLLIYLLARPNPGKKAVLLTGFTIAGLGLSHYGVLVFFMLFGIILVVYQVVQIRFEKTRLWNLAFTILQVAVIAGLLASPWIWTFIQGRFLFIVTTIVAQAPGADPEKLRVHNSLGDIRFFFNTHWYILVVIGVLWAFWRRAWPVILICIWAITLLILSNPHYLGLPGVGLINNFAIFISLFLPFSLILGYLMADLMKIAQARAVWAAYILIIVLMALGVWGAQFRVSFFEPKNQLVTDADLKAMAWVKEHIPPEARFLTNYAFAYNNSSLIGTDAGWWLPLLAQRQNLILPLSAQEVRAPVALKFPVFFRQLDELDLSSAAGYTFLKSHGITHIYIGEKQGQVWNETNTPPLNAESLKNSGFYQEIYRLDNVSVLVVQQPGANLEGANAD